jgi:anti-sigma regulatory factor (Ser/Thr protein kinase)
MENSPLTVRILLFDRILVALWSGSAGPEDVVQPRADWEEIIAHECDRVALDFSGLRELPPPVVAELAAGVRRLQQMGREVWLVGCTEAGSRELDRSGFLEVRHASTLDTATGGQYGNAAASVDLHLQSTPALLARVRAVVHALARERDLPAAEEHRLQNAVIEAVANAMVHGSPEGARNRVRVNFSIRDDTVVVEVADQGRGFDPEQIPLPSLEPREHGYGIHMMRQLMDRVEFFRDGAGLLVRMTRVLNRGEETDAEETPQRSAA